MKRDILMFLCGAAAAASLGHIGYAVATVRGTISMPVWRGRQWGVGKMLVEAAAYGVVSLFLGSRALRSRRDEV